MVRAMETARPNQVRGGQLPVGLTRVPECQWLDRRSVREERL